MNHPARPVLDAAYMAKAESQFTPNSAVGRYYEYDPNWRLRANASLDWAMATWSRTARPRVQACARMKTVDAEPRNKLGATNYHDVQARYQLPLNATVRLGVNNVFKKRAPTSFQAFANSFDPQYDVPDSRYVYMEYSQRF